MNKYNENINEFTKKERTRNNSAIRECVKTQFLYLKKYDVIDKDNILRNEIIDEMVSNGEQMLDEILEELEQKGYKLINTKKFTIIQNNNINEFIDLLENGWRKAFTQQRDICSIIFELEKDSKLSEEKQNKLETLLKNELFYRNEIKLAKKLIDTLKKECK